MLAVDRLIKRPWSSNGPVRLTLSKSNLRAHVGASDVLLVRNVTYVVVVQCTYRFLHGGTVDMYTGNIVHT